MVWPNNELPEKLSSHRVNPWTREENPYEITGELHKVDWIEEINIYGIKLHHEPKEYDIPDNYFKVYKYDPNSSYPEDDYRGYTIPLTMIASPGDTVLPDQFLVSWAPKEGKEIYSRGGGYVKFNAQDKQKIMRFDYYGLGTIMRPDYLMYAPNALLKRIAKFTDTLELSPSNIEEDDATEQIKLLWRTFFQLGLTVSSGGINVTGDSIVDGALSVLSAAISNLLTAANVRVSGAPSQDTDVLRLIDAYTRTQLNTSGAGGQVHWNNITNKPTPPQIHSMTIYTAGTWRLPINSALLHIDTGSTDPQVKFVVGWDFDGNNQVVAIQNPTGTVGTAYYVTFY